jgi:hypothetical protein
LAVNDHKFAQLQVISLSENQITDAGLEALAVNGHKFPQLQKINLSENQITDAGLEALAVNGHKFPQLQKIYLQGNEISGKFDKIFLDEIFADKQYGKSKIKVWL